MSPTTSTSCEVVAMEMYRINYCRDNAADFLKNPNKKIVTVNELIQKIYIYDGSLCILMLMYNQLILAL